MITKVYYDTIMEACSNQKTLDVVGYILIQQLKNLNELHISSIKPIISEENVISEFQDFVYQDLPENLTLHKEDIKVTIDSTYDDIRENTRLCFIEYDNHKELIPFVYRLDTQEYIPLSELKEELKQIKIEIEKPISNHKFYEIHTELDNNNIEEIHEIETKTFVWKLNLINPYEKLGEYYDQDRELQL